MTRVWIGDTEEGDQSLEGTRLRQQVGTSEDMEAF